MELELDDEENAVRVHDALGSIAQYAGSERNGRSVLVPISSSEAPELLAMLCSRGVRIRQAKSIDTSLEDVYLRTVESAKGGA